MANQARSFLGVGTAIGLAVWPFVFALPLGAAAFVVNGSHPGLASFLHFGALVSVGVGILSVAKGTWGKSWRKALPLARISPEMVVWTALGALSFLIFEASLMYVAGRTVGLPNLPDSAFSTGLGPLIGAPLSEEILFRGYGLARIRELGGTRRALFLTALVFSLLHGHWLRLPGTFLLGLFFGWLVLRTGSLWPAFIGHFTINGTIAAVTRLSVPSFDRATEVPWWVIVSLGCTGLACMTLLGSPHIRGRITDLNAEPLSDATV